MFASLPFIRFCTTATAARCNMRCATGSGGWASRGSTSSTTISTARRPAAWNAPDSTAWLRKSASARSARWLPGSVAVRPQQPGLAATMEMCRVVDTVLVDQEAVHAPRQGNDRLLLGLKRLAERVRARPVAAALAGRASREGQARRVDRRRPCRLREERRSSGERPGPPGAGRSRWSSTGRGTGQRPPGAVVVSGTRTRPAGQASRRHDRVAQARYAAIHSLIANPVYGGAPPTARVARGGLRGVWRPVGHERRPRSDWLALKPGTHEGHVDWDRAEAIRTMVSDNMPRQQASRRRQARRRAAGRVGAALALRTQVDGPLLGAQAQHSGIIYL